MSESQSPPPLTKPRRRYKVKPTEKQAKAMDLIAKGVLPTHAMKQAGYSEETSRTPSKNLLGSTGALTIQELIGEAYLKVGITPIHYAEGVQELMTATKIDHSHTEPDKEVPDYQARAKGLDFYRRDQGMDNHTNVNQTNVQVNFGELKDRYKK